MFLCFLCFALTCSRFSGIGKPFCDRIAYNPNMLRSQAVWKQSRRFRRALQQQGSAAAARFQPLAGAPSPLLTASSRAFATANENGLWSRYILPWLSGKKLPKGLEDFFPENSNSPPPQETSTEKSTTKNTSFQSSNNQQKSKNNSNRN